MTTVNRSVAFQADMAESSIDLRNGFEAQPATCGGRLRGPTPEHFHASRDQAHQDVKIIDDRECFPKIGVSHW